MIFNPKINKIHIVHIHGGIPEKKSHKDLVFRTKATIMGFVPLGGYNMILNRGVGQKNLYEKMCCQTSRFVCQLDSNNSYTCSYNVWHPICSFFHFHSYQQMR